MFTADIADDGRPYLVMTFYPKDNLGVRAAQERFPVSEVLRIGIQIASAVETAHRAQILHRDIKPANILTNQYGTVGLTDFGIAAQGAALDDDEDDAGVSVPWSPPEVLYAVAPASAQSDVYSLGATLWHLLVGRSPYELTGEGDNSSLALMRRARDSPVPSTGRADVPSSLDRLLGQAMSKDPAARPPSALDLARSLQAIEQELHLPRTDIVVLSDDAPEPRQHETAAPDANATRMRAPLRVEAQSRPIVAPRKDPERRPLPAMPSGPIAMPSTAARAKSEPVLSDPTRKRPVVAPAQSAAVSGDSPVPGRGGASAAQAAGATVRRPAAPVEEIPAAGDDDRRSVRPVLVVAALGVVVAMAVVVGIVVTSGNFEGQLERGCSVDHAASRQSRQHRSTRNAHGDRQAS